MKKIILLGLLLSVCMSFTACGNSFEMKVTDVKAASGDGTFVIGTVTKGTLKDGSRVTIERDGKDITSVKADGLINSSTQKEVKTISKGDSVYIGLGGMDEKGMPVVSTEDISPNDMIVVK